VQPVMHGAHINHTGVKRILARKGFTSPRTSGCAEFDPTVLQTAGIEPLHAALWLAAELRPVFAPPVREPPGSAGILIKAA
jgi:hypothetical protein